MHGDDCSDRGDNYDSDDDVILRNKCSQYAEGHVNPLSYFFIQENVKLIHNPTGVVFHNLIYLNKQQSPFIIVKIYLQTFHCFCCLRFDHFMPGCLSCHFGKLMFRHYFLRIVLATRRLTFLVFHVTIFIFGYL